MHPFPCSALLTCFGNARETVSFDQPGPAEAPLTIDTQPSAEDGAQDGHPTHTGEERPYCPSERNSGADGDSSNRAPGLPAPGPEDCPAALVDRPDCDSAPFHTPIPRPSIVGMPKKEEEMEGESVCLELEHQVVSGRPPEDTELKDPYLTSRSIMAEPDYIDDDNPELIKPQKLINPVKTSRNHQDLHRELLMNQKRGLAPQNKPELQKVMEKRKRDQVIKQQKEEEAQKKKSDLEIELMKRQQKLEQLELEKQKIQEEQENAPEFVKVKGNLRRTGQEAAETQDS
ncbi:protein FAM107B isoform X1 [Tachyglossus aculeatus]|uniref:protein FAM107B isoform X1 n=1 Tax=Tachyglossus aculeatus TaxID=9261 RepID=UPI0018F40A07|nr:protein FAM107B isoform X1 [Tachyglossus aculeatus]